ncbi:MAG TPA: helix-turn-helix transcriptional regulator [Lachnospiraceae bacterium]|nr:helix-turn-helix transcriptional regulator [Lachnospiraceae bacterium]
MLEYIVLGMVLEEALTGYDIKKYIENGVGVFYKASYGSLYPLLKKQTDKGYLTMVEKPQGGRQKKFYQITEEGRKVFLEWLTQPLEMEDSNDNRLVKVYFFDRISKEIRDQQLEEYERKNVIYLRKLQALSQEFEKLENKECFYYKLSTLYYGICIIKETIRWCRHIKEGKNLDEL